MIESGARTDARGDKVAPAKGIFSAIEAILRTALRGPLADELRKAQREVILARTVVLIWISVFVMPSAILSYVYFLAPAQLGRATAIVLGAIGLVLVHRILIKRGLFDRSYHAAMLLLVGGVFGPTGTAIVEITRESSGDFLFAFYLIYFAFTALFPAEFLWILLTSAAIASSYVSGRFFRPNGLVLDADLTQKLIYFLELTFIGTVLNRVVYRLFFDERRAQIELAAANNALRELDRAKSNFFSNISHEIRTPLTLILTPITHMLQTQRDRLPPDLVAKLEGVRSNANRLLKMVNALLDFAKLEAGHAEVSVSEFNVDDVVEYAGSLFAATAENRGISLLVRCETPGLAIRSDLDKIEKILVNLLGNAVKFTPDGGTVSLRSGRTGDKFVLVVADTGVGIPAQHRDAVFQRFTQLESGQQASVRGTGLGLAMVREYSRLLGGDVALASEVGKGSTFTVTLPIRAAATESVAPTSSPSERKQMLSMRNELAVADMVRVERQEVREIDKAGPGCPRVLVVDDNPALVGLVSSILEEEYNLYLASSGEEALERLGRDAIDLVVSDVMMPGIGGLELVRRMRADERTRHTPIILLTARGGTVQKVEGLETGADDYIGKPFDPDELRARVRSLFALRKTTQGLAEKSTELELAMRKLKDEELKVIESEKLRTLGELAAGVFHELHNYLNIVCNGAVPLKELLTDVKQAIHVDAPACDVSGFDELTELASVMVDAAVAARGVTGELKGYAHQDLTAAPKITDLNALIESTVRLFGARARSGLDLKLSGDPIAVECAPTRLTQVFTNLVKNAFEACGEEGKVEIATSISGGLAVATVTDTGPGVAPAQLAKLFEPFHTTKKQGEGLGLGLSLSRKVMHDLGGDLRYDPTYSGGARFVITLPVKTATRRSIPAPSHAAASI